MALANSSKIALSIVFTALYTISSFNWLIDTIYYKEQWVCYLCSGEPKDGSVSIKQQFLYFSMWSLWFSMAVLVGWMIKAVFSCGNGIVVEKIVWVALPLIITVFISYVYYDFTNAPEGFLNKEACYTLRKSAVSKSITSNETIIDILLGIQVFSDFTIHYFSAPLMMLLLVSGEIKYTAPLWKPFSTFFMLILGTVVYLGQSFGSTIYCGSALFNSAMSILINFVVHCILVGSVSFGGSISFGDRTQQRDGKGDDEKEQGEAAKKADDDTQDVVV